jgi:hypothetical protein
VLCAADRWTESLQDGKEEMVISGGRHNSSLRSIPQQSQSVQLSMLGTSRHDTPSYTCSKTSLQALRKKDVFPHAAVPNKHTFNSWGSILSYFLGAHQMLQPAEGATTSLKISVASTSTS